MLYWLRCDTERRRIGNKDNEEEKVDEEEDKEKEDDEEENEGERKAWWPRDRFVRIPRWLQQAESEVLVGADLPVNIIFFI